MRPDQPWKLPFDPASVNRLVGGNGRRAELIQFLLELAEAALESRKLLAHLFEVGPRSEAERPHQPILTPIERGFTALHFSDLARDPHGALFVGEKPLHRALREANCPLLQVLSQSHP